MDYMEKKMLYKIWKLLDKQSTDKTMVGCVNIISKTNTNVQLKWKKLKPYIQGCLCENIKYINVCI